MLGSRSSGGNSAPSPIEGSPSNTTLAPKPQGSDDFDDDIPF